MEIYRPNRLVPTEERRRDREKAEEMNRGGEMETQGEMGRGGDKAEEMYVQGEERWGREK